MALNADTLLDRLYLKSQISKWRLLTVLFAILALIAVIGQSARHSALQHPYIARLTIDGIIQDDQKIYDAIKNLEDDSKVKAVIVWLNTPGGSAVGGEETFLRLRELAAKKPVVAVLRSVAASAGYMVALGADRIIAREGTITGSIGVIIETAEVTELADKLGIKPVIIKSSPLKGSPSPLEKATPEATQTVHDVVMDFYNHFVDMVADRRGLPRDKVLPLADGRILSGKTALDDKLVDALGGESDAIAWLVDQKHIQKDLEIRDVKINQEKGFLDQLSQSISGKFFQKSGIGLDGLSAIWQPSLH